MDDSYSLQAPTQLSQKSWLNVGWQGMSLTPLFAVRADFPNMKLVDELFEGAIAWNQKKIEGIV